MSSNFLFRIRLLSLAIFVFALIIISRLFFVQVIHGSEYSERADRQYATPSGSVFERGTIYFTKKDGNVVSAATLMSGYKLAVNPKEVKNADATYTKLASVITLDRADFITKASRTQDPYEEIATKLSKEEADAIYAMELPGVYLYKEKWRFYPGNSLASQVLGFVAYKGDILAGRYGLERYYNDTLTLQKDNLYVNFFAEVFSNISDTIKGSDQRTGDIVTTIEPTVQNHLEGELKTLMSKWSAEAAGAIIMDPHTGEIYAMAQAPDFNVNEFNKVEGTKPFGNSHVENVFEMGSIIKPLVMAAALDAGVVTPETHYTDNGTVTVDGKVISNFDGKARGDVSMQEVLNQSLNTGMVHVYRKLGKEKLRDYLLGYGLGEKTNIDLPNETTGLVRNLHSTRDLEYATASFGQGIAVTPVEAIRAFASLANGGQLVSPHLVKEINYKDGGSKVIEYEKGKRVLTEKTSEAITGMLVKVIDMGYGGGAYKMEHYSIGAKTGTAQVAREDGKGYYEDKHLHSFFGYFPAYEPRFVVLFYIRDPKGAQFASQSLLPPFISTTKFLLNYYDVPPDR